MAITSPEISTRTMVPLCRQLATSFDAGIPLIQTLDLVRRQFKDKKVRGILESMSTDIRNGASLKQAAEKQSKYFPQFFVQLVNAGEVGGRLDVMLNDLADYYEDRLRIQREILRSMVIPFLYIFIAWNILPFPFLMLKHLTLQSAGNLDLIEFVLTEYLPFMAKGYIAIAIVVGLGILLARAGIFRWIWSGITTFVWPLAPVTRKFAMARFFRSFGLLLGSGVPVIDSIRQAAAVTANPYIEQDLAKAAEPVRRGDTLVEAFAGSKYMTPTARELLLVGETSGKLEQSCLKASNIHLAEASHAVSIMTRVFGIAILLAVLLAVGAFIITFYMRLYGGLMNELGI